MRSRSDFPSANTTSFPGASRREFAMSLDQNGKLDDTQFTSSLETLIERVVETTVARLDLSHSHKPFLTSRECAGLIAVTPEHLCAMRSRGEGPPWSGEGKWIRYDRRAVLLWLCSLPRQNTNSGDGGLGPDANGGEPPVPISAASQGSDSGRQHPKARVGSSGRLP